MKYREVQRLVRAVVVGGEVVGGEIGSDLCN